MYRKQFIGFLAICAALIGWWSAAQAAPWGSLISISRVDADPKKDYTLTDQHGPWMIMTCSFSGERAEEQAKDLAYELRNRYKVEAFVHAVQFNFDDVQGRGVDRYGAAKKMKLAKLEKQPGKKAEIEEYAVMVGNYSTPDDPEAQRTLQKLKFAQPKCLEVGEGKTTSQSLAGWRLIQKDAQEHFRIARAKKGPMGHAFITTNPRLPKEFFASNGVDEAVLRMNKDVPNSLLDCPGKYTVLVATFKGPNAITQKEIMAVESQQIGEQLAEAAEKAHKLTEALRIKGYEAYEFHDRYASIVTVGSFDSVGTPRTDGRIEINPTIHKIMETFKPEPVTGPGAPVGTVTWKGLVGIPFDMQPMPVQVPRRSITAAYSRN